MKKTAKIILGIVTLWPVIYFILFFVFIFAEFFFMTSSGGAPQDELFNNFFILMAAHGFTMLLTIVLLIIYIANVFRNDRVLKDRKVLWAVVLFLGNMIAMPVYWYLYIWRKPAYIADDTTPGTS